MITLKEYFDRKDSPSQVDFAEALEVSKVYMWQLVHGKRTPSPKVAVKIERLTDGIVKKEVLIFGADAGAVE